MTPTTPNETEIACPAELKFGDFCLIEQERFGAENEMYEHKVISRFKSNVWVEVPVQAPAREVVHSHSEQVVSCVTVGIDETKVRTYRLQDCQPVTRPPTGERTAGEPSSAERSAVEQTLQEFCDDNCDLYDIPDTADPLTVIPVLAAVDFAIREVNQALDIERYCNDYAKDEALRALASGERAEGME